MRIHSCTRFAALAALTGALACAGNKARTEEPNQAAAARDTTTVGRDTTNQNPPGYRGMERDTSVAPQQQGTPTDTTGQNRANPTDTTGAYAPTDTTGGAGVGRDTSGMSGMDSTGMSHPGDTTGYQPSQQPSQDTTTSR